MGWLQKLMDFVDAINEWVGRIVSYLILAIAFIVVITVVSRYIFRVPLLWGLESAQYLFTVIVMLMAGHVLLHDGHVRMDLLYDRFSPKTKLPVDIFTSIFFFVFTGSLFWKGASFFWTSLVLKETTSSIWGPPIYPVKVLAFLGFALLLLQGVVKLVRNIFAAFQEGGKQ